MHVGSVATVFKGKKKKKGMETDAYKVAEKKHPKYVAFNKESVHSLPVREFEKAELVVMDNVPRWVYEDIVDAVREFECPLEILNRRRHYPPHPPVLWCIAKNVEQVVNLKPDFDGQIVLVVAHPDVNPSVYVDIAFHAELRGFLLINTGPWSPKKSEVIVGWDEGIFVSMLGTLYNQLNYETQRKQKQEAAVKELMDSLDKSEAFIGFVGEELGSSFAYAEAECDTDALIELKQKQLSQLEEKLLNVESLMQMLHAGFSGLSTTVENQVKNIISEIMDVRMRRVVLEAALDQLENQLNDECRSCRPPFGVASEVLLDLHNIEVFHLGEKSCNDKGLSKIFWGKTLKKWSWSLLGISASLGLSMLAYSYFKPGVGEPRSYEHRMTVKLISHSQKQFSDAL